ncbi:hypothetical protein CR513_61582, partial [Mucuna pruriens]
IKQESNSSYPRYKARLVVKGFRQRKGVDFNEIFSPVVKMSSIRIVLSLAATFDLEVEQMDVKTTFLHGDLEEEIYMKQPDGFQISGKEDYVCRLKKSLYAPRQWYKKFESVMCEQGYKKTTSDHCVFVRKFSDDDFVILLLYVDDMLIVGKSISRIDRLKKQLSKTLSTSLAARFKLSFRHSPSNEAEKTNMSKVPYASAMGREHWNAAKWILRYLHGTSDLTLCFGGDKPTLVGYSDSDMTEDIDSRKSTSGYLIKSVALSTTKAEFIAKYARSCFRTSTFVSNEDKIKEQSCFSHLTYVV